MSNSTAISLKIPFSLEDAGVDTNKYLRYNLCLHFIKGIIADHGLLKDNSDHVFDQLGHIACCIDTYVDELKSGIKYELAESFPSFYDSLIPVDNASQFQLQCLEYRSKTLFLADQPCSYAALYDFFENCRELGMMADLRQFSIDIIASSIKKQEAKDVNVLLESVADEGSSAVRFLIKYLNRKGVVSEEAIEPLHAYFIRIESVLNIADELLDSKADKRKGIIGLDLDLRYYTTMLSKLISAGFKALWASPLKFLKHSVTFTYKAIKLEFNK